MRYGFATTTCLAFGLLALALPSSAAVARPTQAGHPTLPSNLTAVRAAVDKYGDPIAAVRDGYFSTVGCVDYPGGAGVMAYKPSGVGVFHGRATKMVKP